MYTCVLWFQSSFINLIKVKMEGIYFGFKGKEKYTVYKYTTYTYLWFIHPVLNHDSYAWTLNYLLDTYLNIKLPFKDLFKH